VTDHANATPGTRGVHPAAGSPPDAILRVLAIRLIAMKRGPGGC
jgi:hypothetical protein